jgi:hypothetical protein
MTKVFVSLTLSPSLKSCTNFTAILPKSPGTVFVWAESVSLDCVKTDFNGPCRAAHLALFLERSIGLCACPEVGARDGQRRSKSMRITCEAKGSEIKELKCGYNSYIIIYFDIDHSGVECNDTPRRHLEQAVSLFSVLHARRFLQ